MPTANIPARELDIHNEAHARSIVMEIDSEQNRSRRRAAWIANQCLEGNQKEYVKQKLVELYPETANKFRTGDISIVKKVNDKQSKAYKTSPIRKAGSDKETESLNDIYKQSKFSRAFKEFDSIYNLHKYGFMWLTWQNPKERDAEDGLYIMHALAPYEFDLVRDQVSGEVIIFILNYPDVNVTRNAGKSDNQEQTITESQSDTSAMTRIYSMWTKDKFSKIQVSKARGHGNKTETKEQMSIEFIDIKQNPIGRIPGSYLQKGNTIDYPVTSNLADQSIDWNVSFSDLKTASSTQGHGQLIISHPSGQKMKQFHMGMHTAISLPQSTKPDSKSTTAEYISASPDLGGQLDVLKFDLTNILDDQGVKSKGSVEGGAEKFASGFDRLLSEADVSDLVQDNQGTYSDELEPDMFSILSAYEIAMNQQTFSKTKDLEIHFEKPKVLISDKETLDNIKLRDELGLMLNHEKHIIMNPNLTEKLARKREEDIQAEKQEKMKAAMEAAGAMSNEEDDDDPDNPSGNKPAIPGEDE